MTGATTPKSHYNAFRLWVDGFERSHLGKKALGELEAIYGAFTPSFQKRLRDETLLACYFAYQFLHKGDVNSEKRDLLRDLSNKHDGLHDRIAHTIHEIWFFRSVYDVLMAEGMREMLEGNEGMDTITKDPSAWKEYVKELISADRMLFYLEAYRLGIDRFQGELETFSARDECWVDGNMRYPERIDGINQHGGRKGATCLMFQLAIFFRLWTYPKGQKLFDKKKNLNIPKGGITMPKEGKPNTPIIAAFVKATFANSSIAEKIGDIYPLLEAPEKITAQYIQQRLEKIDPRTRFVPWTHESFDLTVFAPPSVVKAFEKHIQKSG
jgi:hypothetical protein